MEACRVPHPFLMSEQPGPPQYEAKKYAERVGSVGKRTFITVYRQNGEGLVLQDEGKKLLDDAFGAYGPKDIATPVAIKAAHFMQILKPTNST